MRNCRTCDREFEPSSNHKDCPACRAAKRKLKANRICECGKILSEHAFKCISCTMKGNDRNLKGNFTYYVRKAIDRKYPMDIDDQYLSELWLKQEGKCAVSGIELKLRQLGKKDRSHLDTASLDRIDSSIGYVKGNVQFIALGLNYAKQSFSDTEFRKFMHDVSTSMVKIAV